MVVSGGWQQAGKDTGVFTTKSQLKLQVRNPITLALVVIAPMIWLWAQQSNGDRFEEVISADLAADVGRSYNGIWREGVVDLTALSAQEINTALATSMVETDAVSRSELNRILLVSLANVVGAACWGVAMLSLALGDRRRAPVVTELPAAQPAGAAC